MGTCRSPVKALASDSGQDEHSEKVQARLEMQVL